MTEIQDFIPSALNLFGWGVYVGMMQSKTIRPNPFPWFMSLLMLSVSGVSLMMSDAPDVGLMYFSGAIPAFIVFTMSLKYFTRPSLNEIMIIALALTLIVFSLINPLFSILGASAYYLLTYALFISRVYSGVSIEHPAPWGIWSMAGLTQLVLAWLSYGFNQIHLLVIPFVLFLSWTAVFFIVLSKNKIH